VARRARALQIFHGGRHTLGTLKFDRHIEVLHRFDCLGGLSLGDRVAAVPETFDRCERVLQRRSGRARNLHVVGRSRPQHGLNAGADDLHGPSVVRRRFRRPGVHRQGKNAGTRPPAASAHGWVIG
jgi:hypothetical protein